MKITSLILTHLKTLSFNQNAGKRITCNFGTIISSSSPHILKSNNNHYALLRSFTSSQYDFDGGRQARNKKASFSNKKTYEAFLLRENGIHEKVLLTIPQILSSTGINVRDFIALPLASNEAGDSSDVYSDIDKFAPCILPRENAIVCSIGHLKTLIQRSSCLIFDIHKPSVQLSIDQISMKVQKDYCSRTQNFEIVILDAMLEQVCGCLERKAMIMLPIVDAAANELTTTDLSRLSLRKVLPIRDALSLFKIMTDEVRQCLEDLITNDEDMLGLLLTKRYNYSSEGKELDHELHTEVEILLEGYHRQLSLVKDQIFLLKRKLEHSQEVAAIHLDLYRNAMIKLDVQVNVAMLSLAGVATVGGIFGMNLLSGLEQEPGLFYYVTGASICSSFLFFRTFVRTLRTLGSQDNYKAGEVQIKSEQRVIENIGALERVLNYAFSSQSDGKELQKDFIREVFSKETGKQLTNRDLDTIFKFFDLDQNGTIDANEYKEVTTDIKHAPNTHYSTKNKS
mmetsp:Transcript_4558/g.6289  ORF Transcript_4558/g.6289 Transcript_4558/m.6289 type:complete len:511 (+) Transcript_4558:105-1637(+)